MAPFADTSTLIPLAVLGASLAGSAHCAGMCGGLVLLTARSRMTWIQYHSGRLLGYLALGTSAGWLGEILLNNSHVPRAFAWIATALLGFGLILAGVRVWSGRPPHFSILSQKQLSWIYRRVGSGAFSSGLLTALLPCGWLHVFVLGASATQSAFAGAGFILMFWLGTLPALSLAPWLIKEFLGPFTQSFPRAAALLLMLAGALSIGGKMLPHSEAQAVLSPSVAAAGLVPSCH